VTFTPKKVGDGTAWGNPGANPPGSCDGVRIAASHAVPSKKTSANVKGFIDLPTNDTLLTEEWVVFNPF